MNPQLANWISVVTAGIVITAAVAIARMLNGKANKADVDKEFEVLRADNKTEADESLRQYRELKMSIEVLQKEIAALDKHSLTSNDLSEMKGDIKEALKLIDNIPDRVTSLEATRNKQSER